MSGFRTVLAVATAVAVGFGGFHVAADVVAEAGWLDSPAAVADQPPPLVVPTPPPPSPTAIPSPSPTVAPKPKPLMALGDSGRDVRELQVRLRRAGVFSAGMTGYFGKVTEKSVRRYQERRGFAVTGEVDLRTWQRLRSRTGTVTSKDLYPPKPKASTANLDPRCKIGRVVCIDKTARKLRWVVDGDVKYSMSARFGGRSTPTREGRFSIQWKDRDHVSSLYESQMPFSMFFNGGQAVHYSSDFARKGYAGASHGCVNTRSWALTERLFNDTRIGDKVVVYWS